MLTVIRDRALISSVTFCMIGLATLLAFTHFILPAYSQYQQDKTGLELTTFRVYQALKTIGEDLPLTRERALEDPVIRHIIEQNPQFRFYIEKGEATVSYGGPSRKNMVANWVSKVNSQVLRMGHLSTNDQSYNCAQYSFARLIFVENGALGYSFIDNCPGQANYIEIAGIKSPAYTLWQSMSYFIGKTPSMYLYGYALAILGLVILTCYIAVFFNRLFIKLADNVQKLDHYKRVIACPASEMPKEVRPLVHALNKVLSSMDNTRERESFFLATAAHELRTPITILRTRVNELPPSEIRDEVITDIRKMSHLVEQILSLSDLKTVNNLSFSQIDMHAIAQDVCAGLAPIAIDTGVDIDLSFIDKESVIYGDKQLVCLALSNIVNNAIAVSKDGDSIHIVWEKGGVLTVTDEGPGIPIESRETIFDPFSKSVSNSQGHGLGLAIVNRIMQLHHGSVSITDGDNNLFGTRFILKFPTQV